MDLYRRWTARLSVLTAAVVAGVLIPAAAWAADHPVAVAFATEAARRRSRGGGGLFGLLGIVCCLVVVAAIVIAVVLVAKRRKR